MHWGEPAQIMRYLEVIPGDQTSAETLELTLRLGELCGKEPTPLERDIQGFISNRMMYAMLREACYLVLNRESPISRPSTVHFATTSATGRRSRGPFRWMDLTGIPAYAAVMDGLLAKLCDTTETPKIMRRWWRAGPGNRQRQRLLPVHKASARRWEKAWVDFTYEIRKLADRYDAGKI